MNELVTPHIPDADALAHAVPPPEELTPQQVEARHVLVGLYRQLSGQRVHDDFPFVRQLSSMPAPEAQAMLDTERDRYEKAFYRSPRLEEYEDYVTDLQTIRQEQQDYITEVMSRIPEDAPIETKRVAYLEGLEHSPPLAAQTLSHLNSVAVGAASHTIGRRLFSEEQIAEAAGNKQAFQQTLVQIMIKEPAIVLGAGHALSKIADREQIRTALNTLRQSNPEEVRASLDFAIGYYKGDEARDVVMQLAENDPSGILFKIIRPPFDAIIGEENQKKIAIKAVREGTYLPSEYPLEVCLEKGFITRDDIKQRVLADITAKGPAHVTGSTLDNELFFNPEDRQMIKDKLRTVYETANTTAFNSIDRCSALTDKEKQVLVSARFDANPEECFKSLPHLVDAYVPPEKLRGVILVRLASGDAANFESPHLFLDSKALTLSDKRDYALALAEKNPVQLIDSMHYLNGKFGEPVFDQAELSAIVQRIVAKEGFPGRVYNLPGFIGYLGTPAEQRQFIQTSFDKNPEFSVFSSNNKPVLDELFTSDEQVIMLNRLVTDRLADKDSVFNSYDLAVIRDAFPEADYRNVIEQIKTTRPEVFIEVMGEIAYLYSEEEMKQSILTVAARPDGYNTLLGALSLPNGNWIHHVDEATTWEVIKSIPPKDYWLIIAVGEQLSQELNADDLRTFIENMAANNPALSIISSEFFSEHIPGFTEQHAIDRALQDERYMPVMGRYLSETFKKVPNARPSTRGLLLGDASVVYTILEDNLRANTLGGLAALHDRIQPDAKQERTLLDTYDLIVKLGSPEQLAACQHMDSLESVNQLAVQVIARAVGIQEDINAKQSVRLLGAMGRVSPLGLYAAQYGGRPDFDTVLRPMTESLLRGDYSGWKFGPDTAEGLQHLKALGIVPAQLTHDQYRAWRTDSQSSYREQFTVETQTVITEVKRILSDNEAQLPAGSFIPTAEKISTLQAITQDLAGIGAEIAQLHKDLKALKTQSSPELAAAQIDDIKMTLAEYSQMRRELQMRQDIIQLTHLTSEEIISGTMQPTAAGSKGRPVVQVLQRLKKDLSGQTDFIASQLDQVFDSYNDQTGATQTLEITDTAHPKVTMEIGEIPVASCQNYRNGLMNECLLGYTDPNSKVLFGRNERGNPVARAVFRLLSDDQGQPALHVETVYSADLSDGVNRAIYRHAIQKAQAMGVPVFTSLSSQNAEGHESEIRQVAGITYEPVETALSSSNSRAAFVYVDSAGGPQPQGRYTIAGNARLNVTSD